MKRLLLIAALALTGCSAPAAQTQGEPFYINGTEIELGKWIGISLSLEGYPIASNAYHWELTHPKKGFTDDGTRETWMGDVTVMDNKQKIAQFHAVCETSKIDIGQIAIGGLCDMHEID